MRRAIAALAPLALLSAVLAAPAASAKPNRCTDQSGPVAVAGGYVSYPASKPKALVVFFHGINHTAGDWAANHLERVASESGVVTLAMDYPGNDAPGAWQVQEGADASVAAARALAARCRLDTVIAYGVSMGGNASGLAVADAPGLFDWWFDIEGANNVVETYLEARALAPANQTAREALAGIEREMGGPIEAVPDVYARRSNVARSADIAAAGLRKVFMVHGVGDGLVPYDQTVELATALQAQGVPVEVTTIGLRTEGEAGTTIDGYAPVEHESPFAGHANENSTTQMVGKAGFDALRRLLATL